VKASIIGKTLAVKQKGDSLVPKMKEELTNRPLQWGSESSD